MGYGKWDPWRGLDEVRSHLERLADEGRTRLDPESCGYIWAPLADMLETSQSIIVQVELPGITADQILVEIVDGDLLVRGERPCERPAGTDEQEPTHHLIERAHGIFARRFPLPPGIAADGITARLKDGLLTIVVPKGRAKAPYKFSLVVE